MSEAGFELGFSDAGARILSAFLCLMGNDGNSLSRGFLWARYGLPSLLNQAGPPRPPSASWSASCTAPVGEACGLGEYIQVGGMLVSFLLLTCAMFSNQLYQYLRICFSCIWPAWPLCLDLNFSQTWVGNRNAIYWPCKPWEWSSELAGVGAGRGAEVEFYSEYN